MPLVAGVDSSTQGCKVVIVDSHTGQTVREGRAPHPSGSEVHPDAWYDALQEAIAHAGGLGEVKAISVAGQQHGMVALDKDGVVVRKALLWNDTRSAPAAQELIREVGGAAAYAKRTGLVPVASFTASKVRWLRDAEPDNAERVAAIVLPHDWLTWRLRGYGPAGHTSPRGPDLEALTTDRSDVSGTAYWSSLSGEYDWDLFQLAFGRPGRQAGHSGPANAVILPRVVDPPGEDGTTTPDGLLVGPGAGDNAGGALGLGVHPGDVVVSIGTSGAVFAPTARVPCDSTGTVAGFCSADGRCLPLVCTLNGALILSKGCELLGVDVVQLAQLALETKPGAGGATLIPYFVGERTPNLPQATASLVGMTQQNCTRPNFARAYVEGLVCSLQDGIAALAEQGVEVHRVLLIGGAASNEAVQRVAQDVFRTPVHVPTPGEYVARGAAVQAAWVLTGHRPEWLTLTDRVLELGAQSLSSPNVVLKQYQAAQQRLHQHELAPK